MQAPYVIQPPRDYRPGYFNFDPKLLRKWRKALANVRAGSAGAKLLCYGDSTTRGTGAGSGGGLNVDAQAAAYPRRLAAMLNSYDIPARHDGFFGAGWGSGGSDARLTMGAGWANSGANGYNGLGGATISNNTTTNVLSFTPVGAYDRAVVYWGRQTSKGTFDLDIAGGAATSVATAGVTGTLSTEKTAGALAVQAVNITPTTVGQGIDIAGIRCFNSASKDVEVIQAGRSGATASDLAQAGNALQALPALQVLAPDLTILNVGINDAIAGVTESSYKTDVGSIITAAQVSGDIIMVVPTPIDTANATQAVQDNFRAWIYDLARLYNVPLIDLAQRWINYATANGDGFMANSNHPGAPGYADVAPAIANLIARP